MDIYSCSFLILLLPALSFVILALAGMKMSHKTAGLIGTTSLGLVTVLSYMTAFSYFTADRLADGTFPTLVPYNFTWLPLGNLHFDMGILLDPISVMMLIVISTVSFMVHIYSFGYMHGEKGFQRYYAFLSLFTMSMLGLVLATNIFQMYTFWELVGVSSYLLIGFYYPLKPAIAASKKAFIVTRFADMFFLIGILLFGYYTDSFSFSFAGNIQMGVGTTPFIEGNAAKAMAAGAFILPTALVLMFIGGAGKSAMFPLHIWLPDAMEGPTPVSALIHAATMVVAGVFQIARMFPLWVEYAQPQMSIVVWVGVFTAFYAAAVACAQSDIKRVLAFSTISQIAFMMVALGVSLPGHHGVLDNHAQLGFMAGMFHLFTHAMFKACLFLGAGCIIHAVHSNEMAMMGGLRKYMPITHITFLISCLAIAGIPFFSGFSSGRMDYDGYCCHDRLLHVPSVLRHFLGYGECGGPRAPYAARGSCYDDHSSHCALHYHDGRRYLHNHRRFCRVGWKLRPVCQCRGYRLHHPLQHADCRYQHGYCHREHLSRHLYI